MRPLGWGFNRTGGFIKKKKIRTHKDTHSYVFTEDHMRTQGEGKQEKAKRKASGKSKLANTLILDFQNPEL